MELLHYLPHSRKKGAVVGETDFICAWCNFLFSVFTVWWLMFVVAVLCTGVILACTSGIRHLGCNICLELSMGGRVGTCDFDFFLVRPFLFFSSVNVFFSWWGLLFCAALNGWWKRHTTSLCLKHWAAHTSTGKKIATFTSGLLLEGADFKFPNYWIAMRCGFDSCRFPLLYFTAAVRCHQSVLLFFICKSTSFSPQNCFNNWPTCLAPLNCTS